MFEIKKLKKAILQWAKHVITINIQNLYKHQKPNLKLETPKNANH